MISMMITQPNGRQVSSIVSMKDINRFCITIKVIKKIIENRDFNLTLKITIIIIITNCKKVKQNKKGPPCQKWSNHKI